MNQPRTPKPEPITVIYDGHCAICRTTMDRLNRQLGDRVRGVDFRIVPPPDIHPDLTEARCQAQLHALQDGRIYGGAEAMVKILQRHAGWRFLTYFYYLPPLGWIAEKVYAYIARNRFKLSKYLGTKTPECTDACTIHFDTAPKRESKPDAKTDTNTDAPPNKKSD